MRKNYKQYLWGAVLTIKGRIARFGSTRSENESFTILRPTNIDFYAKSLQGPDDVARSQANERSCSISDYK
jgi:hypothetical protein